MNGSALFLFVNLIFFLKQLNKKFIVKSQTIAKNNDWKTYLSSHWLSKSGKIVRILDIFAFKNESATAFSSKIY